MPKHKRHMHHGLPSPDFQKSHLRKFDLDEIMVSSTSQMMPHVIYLLLFLHLDRYSGNPLMKVSKPACLAGESRGSWSGRSNKAIITIAQYAPLQFFSK